MLEQLLRIPYQRFCVNPIAKIIEKYITPIQITLLGGVLGVSVMPALIYQHSYLAILLLLLSGYLDTLDGTVARNTHQISALGTIFDILTDRVVEFAVILGLWWIAPEERSLGCLLILGSILLCVTSFLIVGMLTPNQSEKSFHYSPGLIERAEAFIFFILMMYFPDFFAYLAGIFMLLVVSTVVIRIVEFSKLVHE